MIPSSTKFTADQVAQFYGHVLPEMQQRGENEWRAQCPLHNGKKLSFAVNAQTGSWFCHSECNRGGSLYDLYMALNNTTGFTEGKRAVDDLLGINRNGHGVSPNIEYIYRDEDGKPTLKVVRTAKKQFFQYRPDGVGGWIPGITDKTTRKYLTRILPYKLKEIIKSSDSVWVAEGEKCADAVCNELRLVCTTNPMGAEKWDKLEPAALQHFRDKDVIILPDNNDPGRRHVQQVARSLQGIARSIKIVDLPGLHPDEDVVDWIAKGGTRIELERLAAETLLWDSTSPSSSSQAHDDGQHENTDGTSNGDNHDCDGKKVSEPQRTILVKLAADAKLFHTPDFDLYAAVPVNGHREVCPLRSKAFRRWLCGKYYDQFSSAVGSQALADAMGVLEAQAQYKGPEYRVFIRVAQSDDAIYIDLGDSDWRVIEISLSGWRILSQSPVYFRRPQGMLPFPLPVSNGSLNELRPFVNVADETNWNLLVAWLVGSLHPTGPYPILVLQGEQGTAKTTVSKVLRALMDPATSPVRTTPKEERDLMIGASNSWVVAFDNLSGLTKWLSDALCRLATGGGLAARALYTDDEEKLFDAKRPTILNGIDAIATRQDLIDRAIVLHLAPIPEDQRKDERTFWESFEKARPRIIGALLDAVCAALANVRNVTMLRKPRMADFALWVTAAESALGWPAGTFMDAFTGNRREAVELGLESDPVAAAIRELMEGKDRHEALMGKLYEELTQLASKSGKAPAGWPSAANKLRDRLKRLATGLRAVGIEVEIPQRTSKGSVVTIVAIPPTDTPNI